MRSRYALRRRSRSALRRPEVAVAVVLAAAAIAVAGYFGGKALFDNGGGGTASSASPAPAPAPTLVVHKPHHQQPQPPADLGFPAFATRNTTRIGGVDPVADAAGAALAANPSRGGVAGPAAVTLVPGDGWREGIAAASLTAPPIGAPILVGGEQIPSTTSDALSQLAPTGSGATDDDQVFAIGHTATPAGLKAARVSGRDPAAIAANIARLRQRLTGAKPAHIVVASLDVPGYAMPAAAWAARSGDPILFAGKGPPPLPTLRTLHRYPGVPVYVLGPPSAVSARAFDLIHKVSPSAKRIAGTNPVSNSIDFARYADGDFGWNVNDPGHGLVLANVSRPLDAGASAALSATGTWGPMLVTTSATALPGELHSYLLDLKPGYVNDPTRAVYNHVWLIGDPAAISVGLQSQIDDLVELVKIGSGSNGGAPPPKATGTNG